MKANLACNLLPEKSITENSHYSLHLSISYKMGANGC